MTAGTPGRRLHCQAAGADEDQVCASAIRSARQALQTVCFERAVGRLVAYEHAVMALLVLTHGQLLSLHANGALGRRMAPRLHDAPSHEASFAESYSGAVR